MKLCNDRCLRCIHKRCRCRCHGLWHGDTVTDKKIIIELPLRLVVPSDQNKFFTAKLGG